MDYKYLSGEEMEMAKQIYCMIASSPISDDGRFVKFYNEYDSMNRARAAARYWMLQHGWKEPST